jgi:SPP1 family phage portal protein
MNTQEIIKLIEQNAPMNDIIKHSIQLHSAKRKRMMGLYQSYKGEVPINDREFLDTTKINNKLANDYRGDIVDQIVGYLFGKPVTYQIDNTKYSESEHELYNDQINDFYIRNTVDDLDSETGKKATICGYGARLCYIDKNGQERVMDLPPWEVFFINDGSIDELQAAMRYYEVEHIENGRTKSTIKVEWYDDTNITFYIERDGNFVLDPSEPINPRPHLFDYVPLVKFINNDEEMGDFEKTESLIDAYDRLMSDAQNEIEEQRLAYMKFINCNVDENTMLAARRMGAFNIPEGGNVDFIIKNINDVFLENHKNSLNGNIYKFSKTVDMGDEKFSGSAQTGESRKWKLLGLENKAITKERKFSAALRQMYKILASAWNKKGINIDYLDIYWDFKRNIPVELQHEAEVTTKLKGMVSEKTRLGLLTFVDDPDWEVEQMKMENEGMINLDLVGDGNEPTE